MSKNYEQNIASPKTGGVTPSALALRDLLRPKLALLPPHAVYQLTPSESELLAQCGKERVAYFKARRAELKADKQSSPSDANTSKLEVENGRPTTA